MSGAITRREGASGFLYGASPQARQHKRRCSALRPPSEAEVARMVADFISHGGAITRLAPAYLLPTAAAAPPAEVPTGAPARS